MSPKPATFSRIGLGCVTFGREIDEDASFALLDHALERGITHFDTAAAYGGGASETILGKWLASRKPVNITVATKILPPYDWMDITDSLRRLGVDHTTVARRIEQLESDLGCRLFGLATRPVVCSQLRPSPEMCGERPAQAMAWLTQLETATRPRHGPTPAR